LFVRLGMSEYYGSEGFDRPPSDVYSCFGGFVFDEGGYEGGYEGGSFAAMTGLGREGVSALDRGTHNEYGA
jgi:hypothetical protein